MILKFKKKDDFDLRPIKKKKFIEIYIMRNLKKMLQQTEYTIFNCEDSIFQQDKIFQFDFVIQDKNNNPRIGFSVWVNSIRTFPLSLKDFQNQTGIKSGILSICDKSILKKMLSHKIVSKYSNSKDLRVDLFMFMNIKPSKKQMNDLFKQILELLKQFNDN